MYLRLTPAMYLEQVSGMELVPHSHTQGRYAASLLIYVTSVEPKLTGKIRLVH